MRKNTEFKQSNISLIKSYFYDGNVHTKNELSSLTGLSLAATTNILYELLENKEIEYVGDASSTGGRKSKNYILNKDFKHILMIALLKDEKEYKIESSISDLMGNIINSHHLVSQKGEIEDLDAVIIESLTEDTSISTIILSIPGVCKDGHIQICDYESLAGFNLRDYLIAKFNKDIVIENDVNVASIGLSSLYPDIKHLAFVYQPATDYVGCGLIIDNKLHNGFSHFAGELRYLPYYTHLDQIHLLRSNPKELLKNQILTLCAVVNPELVGYCSDVFDDELDLGNTIDAVHLPKLIQINNYEEILNIGLFNIAVKNMKERGKQNEQIY